MNRDILLARFLPKHCIHHTITDLITVEVQSGPGAFCARQETAAKQSAIRDEAKQPADSEASQQQQEQQQQQQQQQQVRVEKKEDFLYFRACLLVRLLKSNRQQELVCSSCFALYASRTKYRIGPLVPSVTLGA